MKNKVKVGDVYEGKSSSGGTVRYVVIGFTETSSSFKYKEIIDMDVRVPSSDPDAVVEFKSYINTIALHEGGLIYHAGIETKDIKKFKKVFQGDI